MMTARKHSKRIKEPTADFITRIVIMALLILLMVITLYPLYFVLIASFTDPGIVSSGRILLYPQNVTLVGYKNILQNAKIWIGYRNTVFRYVIPGTIVNVLVTTMAAFSLSRKDLIGHNVFMGIFIFTMYFSGGLIPSYLLVKDLHLINNPLVIILLSAFSVYNMIIARTYFATSIPFELHEAAMVDGCSIQRLFVSRPTCKSSPRSHCRCPSPYLRCLRCTARLGIGTHTSMR